MSRKYYDELSAEVRARLRARLRQVVARNKWSLNQLRAEIEKSLHPLVVAFGTDSGWVRVPSASVLKAFMEDPSRQPNEHTYGKVEWFLKTARQRALWLKKYDQYRIRPRRVRNVR